MKDGCEKNRFANTVLVIWWTLYSMISAIVWIGCATPITFGWLKLDDAFCQLQLVFDLSTTNPTAISISLSLCRSLSHFIFLDVSSFSSHKIQYRLLMCWLLFSRHFDVKGKENKQIDIEIHVWDDPISIFLRYTLLQTLLSLTHFVPGTAKHKENWSLSWKSFLSSFSSHKIRLDVLTFSSLVVST